MSFYNLIAVDACVGRRQSKVERREKGLTWTGTHSKAQTMRLIMMIADWRQRKRKRKRKRKEETEEKEKE